MKIPFFEIRDYPKGILKEIDEAILKVTDSRFFVLGPYLEQFEKEFAKKIGVNHAFGVGNGYDALFISLKALGVGPGDEVIVPGISFAATLHAVQNTGATPVIADVIYPEGIIDTEEVKKCISPKTRVILPVHMHGIPCDMATIKSIAVENDIFIVEDYAHSHGVMSNAGMTGSVGHINATSFYPTKILGCYGDGGAITTDDDELADKIRKWRNYGSSEKFNHEFAGVNSRLDEIQAAVLSIKLNYLDTFLEARRAIARHYIQVLPKNISKIAYNSSFGYYSYPVFHQNRQKFIEELNQQGMQINHFYPYTLFDLVGREVKNNSKRISEETLSLPVFPGMETEEIDNSLNIKINWL